MDCATDRVTLLTTRRLVSLDGDRQSAVTLSKELSGGLISSTYGTSDKLFVGFSAGEWGGGLHRIDRRSGNVTQVERNTAGGLCGGPLNSACDPVNGITAVPWNPDCIVAAVGLVHFEGRAAPALSPFSGWLAKVIRCGQRALTGSTGSAPMVPRKSRRCRTSKISEASGSASICPASFSF